MNPSQIKFSDKTKSNSRLRNEEPSQSLTTNNRNAPLPKTAQQQNIKKYKSEDMLRPVTQSNMEFPSPPNKSQSQLLQKNKSEENNTNRPSTAASLPVSNSLKNTQSEDKVASIQSPGGENYLSTSKTQMPLEKRLPGKVVKINSTTKSVTSSPSDSVEMAVTRKRVVGIQANETKRNSGLQDSGKTSKQAIKGVEDLAVPVREEYEVHKEVFQDAKVSSEKRGTSESLTSVKFTPSRTGNSSKRGSTGVSLLQTTAAGKSGLRTKGPQKP